MHRTIITSGTILARRMMRRRGILARSQSVYDTEADTPS
jgi:hypothetical protein